MSLATAQPIASTGMIKEILLAQENGGPMVSATEVQAVAGHGLVGDRNFSPRTGKALNKNLTLIESEKIREFSEATGLAFSPQDARRNVITSGIELNPLLGREFYVGPVRVRGLELCEPCSTLARRTHQAVLRGLVHKGGLRCEIITDGVIRRGDVIGLIDESSGNPNPAM